MVALNPAYAPCKSIDTVKNRVGDFFCESVDRVGSNRLAAQQPRLENELSFTMTASGLPFFINADPIGFAGGMNLFAYASGNPIGNIDPSGLMSEYGGTGDLYRSDPLGHGQLADGTPVDPHVDRTTKNGQKYRYNPDGTPRGNAPKVPTKDVSAFTRELAKLRRTLSRLPNTGTRGGAGARGGALALAMELEFHIKESIEAGRIKVPLFDWILGIEDDPPVYDSSYDINSAFNVDSVFNIISNFDSLK